RRRHTRFSRDWSSDVCSSDPGSIVSPILANIFLHQLDEFIIGLKKSFDKGSSPRVNPAYRILHNEAHKAKYHGDMARFKEILRQRKKVTYVDYHDPGYKRLTYVRYADD